MVRPAPAVPVTGLGGWSPLAPVAREGGAMFGKVRVMVTDCPRFIVIFDNGKRTRLYPVIAGRR